MDEKEPKQEISLPKEEKPEGGIKKIAENLKQFAKKPNAPDKMTSREAFLKKANAEKDPKKRKAILAALRGRMFQ
jgi:hypothetical protein